MIRSQAGTTARLDPLREDDPTSPPTCGTAGEKTSGAESARTGTLPVLTDTRCDLDFGEIASAAFLKVTGVPMSAMEAGTQQFYINFAVEVAAITKSETQP